MTPEYVEILETLQRRALTEGRDHLVATVEWVFPGVAPEMADRLIPRVLAAPAEEEDRSDCANPVRGENGKFEGCAPGEGGGSEGGGRESSPFDHKPPARSKPAASGNPFDHRPPPRAKTPAASKSPLDEKPPTRAKLADRGAGAPRPQKDPGQRVLTESMQTPFLATRGAETEKRKAFAREAERLMMMSPEEREQDPGYRERNGLPPLKKRKGDADDEERVDCEKPIRDENGKFLGCEPGDGSGGGGSSKSEGKESSPFDHRPPARSKAASSPAPAPSAESPFAAKPPPRPKMSAAKQEQIEEQLQLSRIMNPKMTDEESAAQRVSLEQKETSGADRIERLKASGTLKALPSANFDAARKARDELRSSAKSAHSEIMDLQKQAAVQLNDFRAMNNLDDEPIVKGLGAQDENGELDSFASVNEGLRGFTGEGEEIDFSKLATDDDVGGIRYSEFEDMDDEDLEPEEIKQRDEARAAIKDRKGLLKEKAAEAHATFEKLHASQLKAIEDLKAKHRAAKDASRNVSADIEDVDPDDLVDPALRTAAEEAERVLESDDADDDAGAAAQAVIDEYDAARSAAAEMHEQEMSDREEAMDVDFTELDGALSSLRSAARGTKSLVSKFRRAAGIKAPAKKPAAKKPAKAKAKAADPDDDDDVEDEPEDDEE